MRRMGSRAVLALCLGLTTALAGQARGGRYDDQIRSDVAKLLASRSECKNVKAGVEDAVVTLSGSVELDSERRAIIARVRRIAHVEEVDSNILLSPPAPQDNLLYGRLMRRLSDAGLTQLTVQVHEGAVILQGSVRTMRERRAATELAWSTEGVKEVDVRLSVMQPEAR